MAKGLPGSSYSNDNWNKEPSLGDKIDYQEKHGYTRERRRELKGDSDYDLMDCRAPRYDRGKDKR